MRTQRDPGRVVVVIGRRSEGKMTGDGGQGPELHITAVRGAAVSLARLLSVVRRASLSASIVILPVPGTGGVFLARAEGFRFAGLIFSPRSEKMSPVIGRGFEKAFSKMDLRTGRCLGALASLVYST